jgi:hypothetical protein
VVRRRLTLKRIDPWSVLKFGFVANVVLLVMFLLVAMIVWFIIDRLAIVDQICDIALDVGFTQCGVNFGNLFRALMLLGLLWVVVQTAVLVFFSFLHNLLADLTGGLVVTVNDTTPGTARESATSRPAAAAAHATGRDWDRERTTGAPPVPPLRRDPEAQGPRGRDAGGRPTDRPKPDPQAPAGGRSAGSGEVMFGDRPERGSR